MRRTILKAGAAAGVMMLAAAASGCATKGFVRGQVAQEDQRVSQVGSTASEARGTAREALDRANAAHKLAEGKFLYQVVLSDNSVKFPTDGSALSDEARARLDELADRLKSENRNVYLEIQGHTDARGSEAHNNALGLARAEAVRLYLNQQGVPLNRMSTISYGKTTPVAPNDTAEGRSQNRRVVIIVLV